MNFLIHLCNLFWTN